MAGDGSRGPGVGPDHGAGPEPASAIFSSAGPVDRGAITGLVLAGGRGARMGGVDKGLQTWRGMPLVDHVLARLVPQVGCVLVSANRSIADYASRGWPVIGDSAVAGEPGEADVAGAAGATAMAGEHRDARDAGVAGVARDVDVASPAFDGPLAGILAGLRAATTPWLAVVPCDAPRAPTTLVARLAAGLAADASATGAYAIHHELVGGVPVRRVEPLFCLLRVDDEARSSLEAAIGRGERRVERWLEARGARACEFDAPEDAGAFANFNRLDDLA